MRARRGVLVFVVLVVGLALPGAAVAIKCVPPGVSSTSQYFETIPGSSCNRAAPTIPRSGHTVPGAGPIAPGLAAQGGAGHAVAGLVALTGTAPHRSGHGSGGFPGAPPVTGRSFPGGLIHPLFAGESPGGAGWLLWLLLAATAALFLAGGWRARRRGRGA
jgi:hypothetical protein